MGEKVMKPLMLKSDPSTSYNPEDGEFWYDLTRGGYLKPKDYLEGQDLARVEEARRTLLEFESLVQDTFDTEYELFDDIEED